MSRIDFDEFLRKEEEKKAPIIDWEARKDWWLEQIDILFADIQNWLKEYTESNKIGVELNDYIIFEEVFGSYTVRQMKIKISNKTVTLTPVGTILIGTKGRVDMKGNAKVVKFILADKNATEPQIGVIFSDENKKHEGVNNFKPPVDCVWKISTNPPKIQYSELNEGSFLQCLVQVCNGY